MIDTIRFKIPINESIYKILVNSAIYTRKVNNETSTEIFSYLLKEVDLPSYNRKINIFALDKDFCFIEFSIPKFVYGHNLWMVYPEEVNEAVKKLNELLVLKFGEFTDYKKWIIKRIDLCYAWKFRSTSEAEIVMDILQNLNYPRKTKLIYGTSVMFQGDSYSTKFYLKEYEFYKHDFRFIRDNLNIQSAYSLFEHSKGILRFEITLRSKFLNRNRKKTMLKDLTIDWYYNTLVEYFKKTMSGFNLEYMGKAEIEEKLFNRYPAEKARTLLMYYSFIQNEGEAKIKKLYSPSLHRRYLKQLRDAGITLSFETIKDIENFNLKIPSEIVVNKRTVAPAEAEQQKLI